jgi:hypothetical protein
MSRGDAAQTNWNKTEEYVAEEAFAQGIVVIDFVKPTDEAMNGEI